MWLGWFDPIFFSSVIFTVIPAHWIHTRLDVGTYICMYIGVWYSIYSHGDLGCLDIRVCVCVCVCAFTVCWLAHFGRQSIILLSWLWENKWSYWQGIFWRGEGGVGRERGGRNAGHSITGLCCWASKIYSIFKKPDLLLEVIGRRCNKDQKFISFNLTIVPRVLTDRTGHQPTIHRA